MKIIRNKMIPFKGFIAVNLFGVLFVRGDVELKETTLTHEKIHTEQMKEMLFVFFYLWYVIEWLLKLPFYSTPKDAYRAISLEREARRYQTSPGYLTVRPRFKWLKFL